ncbi:YciK family oxidoreductase [Sedimenticola selenatireducens]|jgi:NAD(P)-dependent dehydrogenase (short-subunit alcohol dehydrogenase family)|uniref:YciK family oxidoreductase n=1 Tax=Sedimenticola selenatireducens TaxID=191960 RepID=A0A557S806_9GAMM|nr:YciK family oxidoreductase [Sedimenticola selenatireducens]TVO73559.1 YciK family oxidoreductase [Sedimenticola selenatireducens]TVT63500.1 MAG: YciK family oxidoreductase [Sedimenticola selenatireducens]
MRDYHPPKDLLTGRTLLITGAGDGLGKTAAIACATHGATVILLGRTIAKLEAVYDAIEAAGGVQPAIYPMNLEGATPHDYSELAETLGKEFGSLEGLLHNAAQLRLLSRIDDYDAETWYQVMQVNLNAPFLLTQACLPLLRKANDASIVFTSDQVGREGKAYWGAYGVSKFGLEGLMQILAEETRDSSNIRVNSFDPGPTRSKLRLTAYPGEDAETLKTPDALIPDYLWLMGPDSMGTTGQALSYS